MSEAADQPPGTWDSKAWALRVNAEFFGQQVAELVVPRAGEVFIGGDNSCVPLPAPDGMPWLARVTFTGKFEAEVLDGEGRVFGLHRHNHVSVVQNGVSLHLELVPQFRHRRAGALPIVGSLAWLCFVVMTSAFGYQSYVVSSNSCAWFPEILPPDLCASQQASSGGLSAEETAEYLTRLLNEDYGGTADSSDSEGQVEEFEKKSDIYIPAGDDGPKDLAGGAEEVGPEVDRNPEEEDLSDPAPLEEEREQEEDALELAVEDGTPIEAMDSKEQAFEDGVADADGVEDILEEPSDPTVEDLEGWGLPDWYDASDRARDAIEIELMTRMSNERLRVDPNDLDALSVLSYYQYLNMELEAAEETYDRYIELAPESSAGYNNKALIYKRRGDYQREEGLYRVALALRPNDPTALNNLAVNLSHQGRSDEALAIMRQLETLQPDDPYAHLHRAKIYADLGEDELALTFLRKALEGMQKLDTLHHIEFRQDIRVDPSFATLRKTKAFREILLEFYGDDTPLAP